VLPYDAILLSVPFELQVYALDLRAVRSLSFVKLGPVELVVEDEMVLLEDLYVFFVFDFEGLNVEVLVQNELLNPQNLPADQSARLDEIRAVLQNLGVDWLR
jgi:hypothetical protein